MPSPATLATARKRLDALIAAAEGRDRYVDLELHLRRLTADFPADVPVGHRFTAGGVRFLTAGAGRLGVPVVSAAEQASAAVADGTEIKRGGVLHAEVLLRAGGRWDTLRKRYDGPAEAPLIRDLIEAQVEPVRWFADWLTGWTERRCEGQADDGAEWDDTWDDAAAEAALTAEGQTLAALLYGDRGGGKTVAGLWVTLAVGLAVPGAVSMAVSASRTQAIEDVKENLDELIPPGWASYRGQPEYRYRLANGSRLRLMTADAPEDLKQGDVDFALLNEAAKMDKRSLTYTLGRTRLRSGLVLATSNPPTPDIPKGVWVLNLFQAWEERRRDGKPIALQVFKVMSSDNAAVDQSSAGAALDLMTIVSPRHAQADSLGEMAPLGAKLIHTWDRHKHGRFPPPMIGDITREWTRRRYGRAFDFLGGVDFQQNPYIIAGFCRLFGKLDAPEVWFISDATEQGSEDDFLDMLQLGGVPTGEGQAVELTPDTVLFIGDSSAQWQDRKTRGEQAKVTPPSFAAFKNRGLHIVPPAEKITPEARWCKNPPYGVSLGQVTSWIGRDRLHIAPFAARLVEAFREAEARQTPSGARPEVRYSHAIDVVRYPVWYIEPPTRRKVAPGAAQGPLVSVGKRR